MRMDFRWQVHGLTLSADRSMPLIFRATATGHDAMNMMSIMVARDLRWDTCQACTYLLHLYEFERVEMGTNVADQYLLGVKDGKVKDGKM